MRRMRILSCLAILVLAVTFLAAWSGVAWAEEAGPPGPPATSVEASTEKATPPAGAAEAVMIAPLEVVEAAEPDYKAMYFAALERIQELEAAFEEAIDLARGYRSDWAGERDIAEARKVQADQALKLAETLTAIIKDMKDTINKQHEIIMTLTAPRKNAIELIGGAVIYPREPTNPGVLLGVGWQF